jgi:hypothetical protein
MPASSSGGAARENGQLMDTTLAAVTVLASQDVLAACSMLIALAKRR